METPLDRIAKDMFNITDKNKLLIIEIDDPDDFIYVMKETLTEKQFYVMSLRYGFDEEPMTYQKIGERIGTQKEWVRQIINKSYFQIIQSIQKRYKRIRQRKEFI